MLPRQTCVCLSVLPLGFQVQEHPGAANKSCAQAAGSQLPTALPLTCPAAPPRHSLDTYQEEEAAARHCPFGPRGSGRRMCPSRSPRPRVADHTSFTLRSGESGAVCGSAWLSSGSGPPPPPPGFSLVRPESLPVRARAPRAWEGHRQRQASRNQTGVEPWRPQAGCPLPPFLKMGYRGFQRLPAAPEYPLLLPICTGTRDGT